MAVSICPKCGNRTFEAKECTTQNSNYKIQFIQCASCGTVVGAMDFWSISNLIIELAKKLGFKLV
jgi:Fe2+ or Zn2+ uptake regulation protein